MQGLKGKVEQGHVSQTAGDVEGLEQQRQAEETLALVRSLLEAGVGQGRPDHLGLGGVGPYGNAKTLHHGRDAVECTILV
ncbi:unnamed protein product [Arctogadus glacialis]